MVADLKYNSRQGAKICEIQQASLSLFNGDIFRNKEEESIYTNFVEIISSYNQRGWVVEHGLADKNILASLTHSSFWKSSKDLMALVSDADFMNQAKQPIVNSYDLSCYKGFLYINWSDLCVINDFEKRFPGIVVLDKSSFPFWIDKYQMTQLFAQDELLATLKPKWGHYTKKYTPELASRIADDLQCDTFVIKPRGEFLGKGIIIVQKQELDTVLQYIITKEGTLTQSTDPAYTAWQQDYFDSFIVEEFITSDPITIPHLQNKSYQPTMRVAFLLVYDNHKYHIHFLGEYWKTPEISLDEIGNFMEKNKDICKPPYYDSVDTTVVKAVRKQLKKALPILHSKMLNYSLNEQIDYHSPLQRRKIHLVVQEVNSCKNSEKRRA